MIGLSLIISVVRKISVWYRKYFCKDILIVSQRPKPLGKIGQTAGPPSQNDQAGYIISFSLCVYPVQQLINQVNISSNNKKDNIL